MSRGGKWEENIRKTGWCDIFGAFTKVSLLTKYINIYFFFKDGTCTFDLDHIIFLYRLYIGNRFFILLEAVTVGQGWMGAVLNTVHSLQGGLLLAGGIYKHKCRI